MRFISIDPGTVTCGLAFWEIDINFNIISIVTQTLYIDNDVDVEYRLHILYNRLYEVMYNYQPYQVAHESGFINRFRPQAYGPIYAAIYNIRKSFIDIYGKYGIFAYPPKTVKSVLSTGNANKDDMLTAVVNIKELQPYVVGYQTEHEIDAIAIGYTHLLNIRENPELLFI